MLTWTITGSSLFSLYLTGRHLQVAWGWGLLTQGLWITYGLLSSQPPFTASGCAFAAVYVFHLVKYFRRRRSGVPDTGSCQVGASCRYAVSRQA
jgi:hypothetical protein